MEFLLINHWPYQWYTVPQTEESLQKLLLRTIFPMLSFSKTIVQIIVSTHGPPLLVNHFKRKIPENPEKLCIWNFWVDAVSFSKDKSQLSYTVFVDGSERIIEKSVAQQHTQEQYFPIITSIFLEWAKPFSIKDPHKSIILNERFTPYIDTLGASLSRSTSFETLSLWIEKKWIEKKRLSTAILATYAYKTKLLLSILFDMP